MSVTSLYSFGSYQSIRLWDILLLRNTSLVCWVDDRIQLKMYTSWNKNLPLCSETFSNLTLLNIIKYRSTTTIHWRSASPNVLQLLCPIAFNFNNYYSTSLNEGGSAPSIVIQQLPSRSVHFTIVQYLQSRDVHLKLTMLVQHIQSWAVQFIIVVYNFHPFSIRFFFPSAFVFVTDMIDIISLLLIIIYIIL